MRQPAISRKTQPGDPRLRRMPVLVGLLILIGALLLSGCDKQETAATEAITTTGLCAPGTTGGATTAPVTGAPRLAVAVSCLDYGDMTLGQDVVEAVFTAQNVGDQPLVIQGEPRVEIAQGC